jgi:hypothetical protein
MNLRPAYEEGIGAVSQYYSVDGVFRTIDLFGTVFTCLLFGQCVTKLCELYSDHNKNKPSSSGRRLDNISWIVLLASCNLCVICELIATNMVLYTDHYRTDLTSEQHESVRQLIIFRIFLGVFYHMSHSLRVRKQFSINPSFSPMFGSRRLRR